MSNEIESMTDSQIEKERAEYEELIRDPDIRRSELLYMADEFEEKFKKLESLPTHEAMYEMGRLFDILQQFQKSYMKAQSNTY